MRLLILLCMLLFRGVYMNEDLEWRSRIWQRIPYGLDNVDSSIRYFLVWVFISSTDG